MPGAPPCQERTSLERRWERRLGWICLADRGCPDARSRDRAGPVGQGLAEFRPGSPERTAGKDHPATGDRRLTVTIKEFMTLPLRTPRSPGATPLWRGRGLVPAESRADWAGSQPQKSMVKRVAFNLIGVYKTCGADRLPR
jgi:hypothetical protein